MKRLLALALLATLLPACTTARRLLNPPPATQLRSTAEAALAPQTPIPATCGVVAFPDQRGRLRSVATAGLQFRQHGEGTRVLPLQGSNFLTPYSIDVVQSWYARHLCSPKAAPAPQVSWEGIPPDRSNETSDLRADLSRVDPTHPPICDQGRVFTWNTEGGFYTATGQTCQKGMN